MVSHRLIELGRCTRGMTHVVYSSERSDDTEAVQTRVTCGSRARQPCQDTKAEARLEQRQLRVWPPTRNTAVRTSSCSLTRTVSRLGCMPSARHDCQREQYTLHAR